MKILKFAPIILLILATFLIASIKPKLHKSVNFEMVKVNAQEKNLDMGTTEDKIAWNTWHSNLVNKILKEQKPTFNEPMGTINYIEFNVDDQGNIFNVKVSTDPSEYTQEAKKYYIPFLTSLSGDAILKFPNNSQRKVILCRLSLKISDSTQYSQPEDFADVESVRK